MKHNWSHMGINAWYTWRSCIIQTQLGVPNVKGQGHRVRKRVGAACDWVHVYKSPRLMQPSIPRVCTICCAVLGQLVKWPQHWTPIKTVTVKPIKNTTHTLQNAPAHRASNHDAKGTISSYHCYNIYNSITSPIPYTTTVFLLLLLLLPAVYVEADNDLCRLCDPSCLCICNRINRTSCGRLLMPNSGSS